MKKVWIFMRRWRLKANCHGMETWRLIIDCINIDDMMCEKIYNPLLSYSCKHNEISECTVLHCTALYYSNTILIINCQACKWLNVTYVRIRTTKYRTYAHPSALLSIYDIVDRSSSSYYGTLWSWEWVSDYGMMRFETANYSYLLRSMVGLHDWWLWKRWDEMEEVVLVTAYGSLTNKQIIDLMYSFTWYSF